MSNLIAVQHGNRNADGTLDWAVIRGHEIDGDVLAEGLTERDAKLFAASEELLAALQSAVAIASEAHTEWDAGRESRVGKLLAALAGDLRDYRPETTAIHAAIAKATT